MLNCLLNLEFQPTLVYFFQIQSSFFSHDKVVIYPEMELEVTMVLYAEDSMDSWLRTYSIFFFLVMILPSFYCGIHDLQNGQY